MNDHSRDDKFMEIFRKAANARPVPDGTHLIDDEELLLRWVEGELKPDEHAAIVRHLANCSPCRAEVAAMVRAGALNLPESMENTAGSQAAKPEPADVSKPLRHPRRQTLAWAAMAAAASLLIVVAWSLSESGSQKLLALARHDLESGKPLAAIERVEKLLDSRKDVDPQTAGQAKAILEESGYAAIQAELKNSQFDKALAVQRRVADRTTTTSRLLNLRLQAEQKIPAEHSLALAGRLTDYGYTLDGFTYKSMPVIDGNTKSIDQQYVQAVAAHPNDVNLRLNYGQFLLKQSALNRSVLPHARAQFLAVLADDENNCLARIGLGLLEYERKKYQKALDQFEMVLEVEPDNLAAQVNAAMCLDRLQRKAEAQPHWRRAAELTDDADFRKGIELYIEQDNL